MQRLTKMIELPENLVMPSCPIGDILGFKEGCLRLSVGNGQGIFHKPSPKLTPEKQDFMMQAAEIIAHGGLYFSDPQNFIQQAKKVECEKLEIGVKFYMANGIIINSPQIIVGHQQYTIALQAVKNDVGTLHSHPEPGTFSPKDTKNLTNGSFLFIWLFNSINNHWAILTRNSKHIIYEVTQPMLAHYTKCCIQHFKRNEPSFFYQLQAFMPNLNDLGLNIMHLIFPKIIGNLGYIYQEAPTPEMLILSTQQIFQDMLGEMTMKRKNPPKKMKEGTMSVWDADSWEGIDIGCFFEDKPPDAKMKKFLREHVVTLTPEEQKRYEEIERRCRIENDKMYRELEQEEMAKKAALRAAKAKKTSVAKKLKSAKV